MDALSVVLASNRGPLSFVRAADGFETKRGAGGLAGAVDPVARRLGDRATWICATTSDDDRAAVAAGAVGAATAELGYGVRLLHIPKDTYAKYYDVVSNRMLWFANHALWDELDVHEFGDDEIQAWSDAYEPVNRKFAEAIADAGNEESLVLVQDYHLATTPRHLREIHPHQTILHFTHSSFAGPKGMEPLPEQITHALIDGMLGADLVGFHVHEWARGFADCCEDIGAKVDRASGEVTYAGRTSWIRTYPIPVDPTSLREIATGDEAVSWRKRFAGFRPEGGTLIIRADRTEPSKNIVRGFQAYGALLDRNPSLLESTRFAACLYPSRESMREYRDYATSVRDAVDEVNARHPDAIHVFMEDDFDRTLAALTEYDILLVNPIMDGMNLVSKEGPCLNERGGVLVLSQGAGSFEELGEHAVVIQDPLDVDQTADALERALMMPETERRSRARSLQQVVLARKPGDWIGPQLDDLRAIRSSGAPITPL
jgi:trehalose 6-phosphate synthase